MTTKTEDKRRRIMEGAERLFTSRRFHEITMDEVARAAGVGKGTIYRYFRDKDDLFLQVATRGYEELHDLIVGLPHDGGLADRLDRACRAIGDFYCRRRQLLRMITAEEARLHWCRRAVRERMNDGRLRIRAAVSAILADGVRQNSVRGDVSRDVLAAMLLGMLRTRARDLQDVDEDERSYAHVLDLFLHGAGASAIETKEGRPA